jgi:hypothetical protein
MKYEQVVEILPDGRAALRLAIVKEQDTLESEFCHIHDDMPSGCQIVKIIESENNSNGVIKIKM